MKHDLIFQVKKKKINVGKKNNEKETKKLYCAMFSLNVV